MQFPAQHRAKIHSTNPLERDSKRLAARLRFAGQRQQATPEGVDHRAARGLDRALFQRLTAGEWVERHQNLLVIGPTGTGKTWLSCALGHRACRDNRAVLYQRVPRMLEALGLAYVSRGPKMAPAGAWVVPKWSRSGATCRRSAAAITTTH